MPKPTTPGEHAEALILHVAAALALVAAFTCWALAIFGVADDGHGQGPMVGTGFLSAAASLILGWFADA